MGGEALQAQIAHLQHTFNAAAGSGGSDGAGEAASEEEGEEEGGEEGGARAGAGALPQQQQWAVEQLCALAKLPSAGVEERRAVLRFLALHAFVRLDPSAAAKAKDKALRGEVAVASAALAPAARRLCASRLIALADSLSKHPKGPAGQQQGQQKGQQAAEAAQAARHDFVPELVAYVDRAARSPGAALLAEEASEAAEAALGALRTLGTALGARLEAAGDGAGGGEEAARLRALQHLAALMALGALGDPEAADAGAAQDLEAVFRVAFEGAQPAAAGEQGRRGLGLHPQAGYHSISLPACLSACLCCVRLDIGHLGAALPHMSALPRMGHMQMSHRARRRRTGWTRSWTCCSACWRAPRPRCPRRRCATLWRRCSGPSPPT